jgi:hypothetical protein
MRCVSLNWNEGLARLGVGKEKPPLDQLTVFTAHFSTSRYSI